MLMAGTTHRGSELPQISSQAEPKRRKLRKGTLSCWSCKRRKIRCSFRAPTDTICDGCQSRGIDCVSQEFPDEPPLATRGYHVDLRLNRMEAVVQNLIEDVNISNNIKNSKPSLSSHEQSTTSLGISSRPSHRQQEVIVRLPSPSTSPSAKLIPCKQSYEAVENTSSDYIQRCSGHVVGNSPAQNEQDPGGNNQLYTTLSQAWPCQRDLDIILDASIDCSIIFHGTICVPYSSFLSQEPPSLEGILRFPPPGAHPVLVARKLLILATLLQGVPMSPPTGLDGLSTSHRDIMGRAAETAVRLVTSNDEILGCVEGIECVMLEAMYHNNAGNLRRSWLAMRRAMATAQMMRLHCNPDWSSVRTLELETCARLSLEHLWYRLVQSDRYLSLMLGLPPGSVEDDFAMPQALESCTPMERMERLQSVAGGRILQRRRADLYDMAAMQQIDKMLQSAAAIMPAQWWLIPNLDSRQSHGMDTVHQTIRMMNQFAHYIILLQLHLPYMLCTPLDGSFDYSKITAVDASRELLARFVSFRSYSPSAAYCRGIDFLAFIASTALCLAHIDASRQQQSGTDGAWGGALSSLLHQRLSDRGMMERALECLELTAGGGADVLASKIANILRHLLIIEGDAANGNRYHASSVSEDTQGEPGCDGHIQDGGNSLQISIPYFGTIEIQRSGVCRSKSASSDQSLLPSQGQQETVHHTVLPPGPAGYRFGEQSSNADWQPVPYANDFQARTDAPTQTSNSQLLSGNSGSRNMHLLVPGLAIDVNDWELQGVDMAVFDTLLLGTDLDLSECNSWAL